MSTIFRAYSRHGGNLFYEANSFQGILDEHIGIAGDNNILE